MSFRPTAEQEQARDLYWTGGSLRIEALAGSGKTRTLLFLVESGSPRGGDILYTAFNKKVTDDGKARFGRLCKVSTNHALAWRVGRAYNDRGRLKGRVTPADLINAFGWNDNRFTPYVDARTGAFAVIDTIARFSSSADSEITGFHAIPVAMRHCRGDVAIARAYAAKIGVLAREVWSQMANPGANVPIVHDTYLKLWALSRPKINATTILLDEAQDASGVMVGVLADQSHAQLVIVGDRHQAIYGFRGAVNAMEAFDIQNSTALTQSFRFGPRIAAVANVVLAGECDSLLRIEGAGSAGSVVAPVAEPRAVLGRTNAGVMSTLVAHHLRKPKERLGVVGGVDDMIKLLKEAEIMLTGGRSNHPDLAEFRTWAEVEDAAKHEAYVHLQLLVEQIDVYGPTVLIGILENCRDNEKDPESCKTLYSTAHKAKGSEFDTVALIDDFNGRPEPEAPGAASWDMEEGNLLYVAVTRARYALDITTCSAVLLSPGFKASMISEPAPAPVPPPKAKDARSAAKRSCESADWSRTFTLPAPNLILSVAAVQGMLTVSVDDNRTGLTIATAYASLLRCELRSGKGAAILIVGDASFAIGEDDAQSLDAEFPWT